MPLALRTAHCTLYLMDEHPTLAKRDASSLAGAHNHKNTHKDTENDATVRSNAGWTDALTFLQHLNSRRQKRGKRRKAGDDCFFTSSQLNYGTWRQTWQGFIAHWFSELRLSRTTRM